jgi:hypothetical protein
LDPPPPPPPIINPLNVVNPAGVLHVQVPTVLNATTVWFPLVVTSGVQFAALAGEGKITFAIKKSAKEALVHPLRSIR